MPTASIARLRAALRAALGPQRDVGATDPRDRRDLRMQQRATVMAILMLPPLAVFYALAVSPVFLWIYLAAAAAFALNTWVVLPRHGKPQLAGATSIWILYGLLVPSFWMLGGTESVVFAWVLVLPVAGTVVANRSATLLWTTLGIATSAVFWLLPRLGVEPPAPPETPLAPYISLVSTLSSFGVISILMRIWINLQGIMEQQLAASLAESRLEAENVALLRDASAASNTGGGFATVVDTCLARLVDATQASAARLWLADRDRDGALHSFAQYCARGGSIPLPPAELALRLLGDGRGARVASLASSEFVTHDLLVQPIASEERLIGVLELHVGRAQRSPDRILALAAHVAEQLAHVAERERTKQAIERLAFRDPVSGLPNRQAFEMQLDLALRRAAKRGTQAALLFVDLNGFKQVNDSLGHAAGDELLRTVAQRLAAAVRHSDHLWRAGVQPVSRFGGDEFTLLLTDVAGVRGAETAAQRILGALDRPVKVGSEELAIGASIGIALYPSDAADPQELIRLADRAMYQAKLRGTSSWERHRSDQQAERARVELENGLRAALASRAITLHYQPIFSAREGTLVGAEALARWVHPERGEIAPAEFIPIAEHAGLVHQLGCLVLDEACKTGAAWSARLPADFRIAANLSGRQLLPAVLEHLKGALARHGCEARRIELELPEPALAAADARIADGLAEISALGVRLALDDFGAGAASLGLLKQFPIRRLKIDRGLVRALPGGEGDSATTLAILAMAHSLGLTVVAEGVEDEAQQEFLAAHGCDELQGYLLGMPVPAAEFEARWLR